MFRRQFQSFILACASCLLIVSSVQGQIRHDERVPANMKAIAAINIDVQTLYKNKLIKNFADLALTELGELPIAINDLTKISAFVAAPKDISPTALEKINFYVYVGFKNAETSKALKQTLMSSGGREVKIGGKSMIAPPEDSGFYVEIQPNYMLAGTEDYLTSKSNQFASKGLAEVYAKLPDAPVRLAVDLDSARPLLDKLSAIAKENADFLTKPYVSLIDEVASLSITSDLDKNSILKLTMTGHDESEGKKIKLKMDALLGLGKQAAESMPVGGPETILMAAAKDTEAVRTGNSVAVELKKPAGFEDMVIKMVGAARKAASRAQDMNNIKQVLIGMLNYHDVHKRFPFDKHVSGEDNDNGFSWAVHILPYIEQFRLYEEFDMTSDYKTGKNAELGKIVVPTLRLKKGQIKWVRPTKVANNLAAIRDGSSNTVAFVQSKKVDMAPWTKPTSIKPAEVLEEFKALKKGEAMLFGMYDGSVRRISTDEYTPEDIGAMLEPADGKIIQR